jgi:hypothetical protein
MKAHLEIGLKRLHLSKVSNVCSSYAAFLVSSALNSAAQNCAHIYINADSDSNFSIDPFLIHDNSEVSAVGWHKRVHDNVDASCPTSP